MNLLPEPILAERVRLDGYGRGIFRMGGMEHRGSLLILPDGMFHWPVVDFAGVTVESLAPVLRRGAALSFLLLGTGATQVFPDRGLREAFAKAGLGLEPMDTGAACRTYNVLLPEARVFAAALIALPG